LWVFFSNVLAFCALWEEDQHWSYSETEHVSTQRTGHHSWTEQVT